MISANGVQAAINHWAHGKCPLTAQQFITISTATGLAVDVMIAQGALESALGTKGTRPMETHNIYNVGNVDSGANKTMNSWYQGAYTYASLMVNHYGKTAEELIAKKFRNDKGECYASDLNYVAEFEACIKTVRLLISEYSHG